MALFVGDATTPVTWKTPNEPSEMRPLVKKLEAEEGGIVIACVVSSLSGRGSAAKLHGHLFESVVEAARHGASPTIGRVAAGFEEILPNVVIDAVDGPAYVIEVLYGRRANETAAACDKKSGHQIATHPSAINCRDHWFSPSS